MRSRDCRLQFITHHTVQYSYLDSARLALQGGCRWVQLRMKGVSRRELEECALRVQAMCKEYKATFIIDDDVLLARKIEADGVHLGKDDMAICEARDILGDGYILGATVNTFGDVVRHVEGSAPDYFGCGPFRFTKTKERLAPMLGIAGYRDMMAKMRRSNITIPLVAIGGIAKSDIPLLLDCGVDGIALSGSVLSAEDPIGEMRDIANIIYDNNL